MSGTTALAAPAAATSRRRSGAQLLHGLARTDFVIGALLVAFWAFCAIFPDVLTSADPTRIQAHGLTLLGEPKPPGSPHLLLGTDSLGRDFFSRVVHGARVAMIIAIVPNVLALALATVVGVVAGVLGAKVEFVLMRITEAIMVLPGFLIAMAVISTFGPSTWVLILVLVGFSWTYTARVVYGETLRIREMLFVEAALSVGAGRWRIAATHIVPHLRPLLVVYFTMNAAFMVLLEAGLGFLGFGVQPPTPSWGLMLAEARDQFFYPWLIIAPGLCLASLSIGFYLLGQGIQNAGRPREKAVVL
jgi:peptide/nickel transport system permease protein